MDDPVRRSRLLLQSAANLADASSARAIMVAIDALPDEIETLPERAVLIARDEGDRRLIRRYGIEPAAIIEVPDVELDRLGQVKLAAIIALSNRILDLGETVIFLTGPFRSIIDTLVVMSIGSEYELFDTTEQPTIDEHIKRAVFHRVLTLALELGQHGREGRRVGTILVAGDHGAVLERSEQMILNPFKGYEERERNILDDRMLETIKEYSTLDGAFIIRGNGVVETAGARLTVGSTEGLPPGLGARHAAAVGITANTRSIAITVSESDGTVRVFRAGRMVASFEPSRR